MLPKDYRELQNQFEKQRIEEIEKERMKSPYYLSQQNRAYQLESRIINITKQDDNIYANIVIDHPPLLYYYGGGQTGATGPPVMGQTGATGPVYSLNNTPVNSRYEVTKDTIILDRAGDYYCSIIKFDIPLNNVPLLIMPIVPNQSDNDLTPLVVGIVYNGVNYPLNLIYLPSNSGTGITGTGFQNQKFQVINPYYYVYEYEVLIRMTNLAIEQAYINSGIPALFSAGSVPPAPFLYLDPISNLVSLVVHTMWTSLFSPLTGVPQLYMNTQLANYFDSFYFTFKGYDQPQGRDYIFITAGPAYPTPNQGYALFGTTPTNPPTYYRFVQEYSALQYWSSFKRILITSNTIPVNPEFVPTLGNVGGLNVSFPIISDFTPQIEGSAGTSRSIAYYVPQGQYKLVDLISDSPLQKLDIQIYWQDRNGNNYPITVSYNQQITVKIAFFRKDLYKNGMNNLLK